MTTSEDYRKKVVRRKTVTVPSGASFEVRAFSVLDFWNIKGVDTLMQGKIVDPKANIEFFKMALTKCVLSPKIVLENPKKDELGVEDLDNDDASALVNDIFSISIKKENSDFLAGKGK